MIFLCIFYFFVEIIHLLIGIKCVSNLSSLFGKTFIDLLICEAKKEWVSIILINSPNACYSLESESGNATWVCHLGASDPIAWPITTSLACILTGCWSHEPELGIISRYFSMGLRSNQWLLPNAYMLQCVSWLFITKTKHPRILQRGEVDWIYSFRGLDPRWFGSPGLSSDESGRRQRQNVDRRSHYWATKQNKSRWAWPGVFQPIFSEFVGACFQWPKDFPQNL